MTTHKEAKHKNGQQNLKFKTRLALVAAVGAVVIMTNAAWAPSSPPRSTEVIRQIVEEYYSKKSGNADSDSDAAVPATGAVRDTSDETPTATAPVQTRPAAPLTVTTQTSTPIRTAHVPMGSLAPVVTPVQLQPPMQLQPVGEATLAATSQPSKTEPVRAKKPAVVIERATPAPAPVAKAKPALQPAQQQPVVVAAKKPAMATTPAEATAAPAAMEKGGLTIPNKLAILALVTIIAIYALRRMSNQQPWRASDDQLAEATKALQAVGEVTAALEKATAAAEKTIKAKKAAAAASAPADSGRENAA